MRPACFHSRSVARWVCQSTRLWICMRSSTSVPSSRIESCIWRIPLWRLRVHTLVATKAGWRRLPLPSSSPSTASARPYIGELSSTEPPAA